MTPLLLIARAELRTRWAGLLLIGLLMGLAGGTVVGSLTLARRAATADARLADATNADDVRSLLFGGSPAVTGSIGRQALDRPEVADGRIALGTVARVETDAIVYLGVMVGPDDWEADVLTPVLSIGRLPDPGRADEVLVNEAAQRGGPLDIDVGDRLTLHLLSTEEFPRFDARTPLTGEAGDQVVTVVGSVRFPGSPDDVPPLIGTAALAAAHPRGVGVLGVAFVRLDPEADADAYRDAVNGLSAPAGRSPALEPFPTAAVISTDDQSRAATQTTTDVLTVGLLALAGAAALVGGAAVTQATLRHHAGSAQAQRIEAAMGLSWSQRAGARMLATIPAMAVALVLTVAAGLATAGLAPPGELRVVEPNPGWSPNRAVIATTAALLLVALATITALSAARAIRRVPHRTPRESPVVARVASLGGRPPTILGLRFALERPAGPGRVSTRAAIVTIAGGITVVVAAMTFSTSLERLVRTPVRYGHPTQMVIADADPEIAAELSRDDRFDTLVLGRSSDLLVDGQATSATSQAALEGELEWEIAAGRPPATDDEIVLGTRLADDLSKGVGDVVELQSGDGTVRQLAVVGVGVLPNYSGGGLGRNAALTDEGLGRNAFGDIYGELGLSVRPGLDPQAVYADLRRTYEVQPVELPISVANLNAIERVPTLLALFLVVLCVLTLAHAITSTHRRRRADLATVRALGFTRGQSATAMVVTALTISLSGVLLALPVGVVLGTTIWRLVAEGAAVLGDAAYPWALLLALVPVAAIAAVALTARPALSARRETPSTDLRAG